MRKEPLFTMQMPDEVKKKLDDVAKKNHRSMANMIIWLIEGYWGKEKIVDVKETVELTEDSTK